MLATWGTSTGFSPSSLFSGGVQGAWYDPSDNSTMFQDVGGVTPVTAVEQAVGLILDKSKALALGGDIKSAGAIGIVGTATAATYNTITGAGTAARAGDVLNQSFVQWSGLTAGAYYRIVVQNTGSTFLGIRHGSNGAFQASLAAGTTTSVSVAASSGGLITFTANTNNEAVAFTIISFQLLAGNHAYQSTSASRPTLRARYNLLTYSEQFNDAAWSTLNAAIVSNSTVAPDGTTTADTFNVTDASNVVKRTNQILSVTPSGVNAFSVYVKAGTQNFVQLLCTGDVQAFANFDVSAGTVGTAGTKTTASIQNVGSGWYRCVAVFDATTVYTGATFRIQMATSASAIWGGTTTNTGTFFLWGAQLVPTAVFPSNVYQRIAAATDYATGAAFPQYLAFDGTDDSLLTASVDFTGTDKMTVFSGLSKLSDAAAGTVVELSATLGSNNGTFLMRAPDSTAPNYYGWYSKGTVFLSSATATSVTYAAPATSVLTGVGDISVDTQILRINAVQAATAATDQGTGNYGTYPLYIGRRNNATLPFNGRIYSLIVRGAASNSSQVAQTERYVASKTPLGVVP